MTGRPGITERGGRLGTLRRRISVSHWGALEGVVSESQSLISRRLLMMAIIRLIYMYERYVLQILIQDTQTEGNVTGIVGKDIEFRDMLLRRNFCY